MKAFIVGGVAAFFLSFGTISAAQDAASSIPNQPFTTVHLMAAQPAQEAALRAAVENFNQEFTREGCAECIYHYARIFSGSQSPYTIMLSANWPSRNEYLRLHASPAFQALYRRNPVFAQLEATQFYGRMVESK